MKKRSPKVGPADDLVRLTVRIPASLLAFLNTLKETNGVIVQHAVKEALEDYRKKRGA